MGAVFVGAGAGSGSVGMAIQHTMYATIPGSGGKMAARIQRIRMSVTSTSK
jgi:hypothetical protein